MNLTPPPAEPATAATPHYSLIRRDWNKHRDLLMHPDSSGSPTSGSPPRARPLPGNGDTARTADTGSAPELTSAAALLALLFGRH